MSLWLTIFKWIYERFGHSPGNFCGFLWQCFRLVWTGLLSGLESLSGIASLGRFSRRCLLTENPAAVLHDCVMSVSVARALRRWPSCSLSRRYAQASSLFYYSRWWLFCVRCMLDILFKIKSFLSTFATSVVDIPLGIFLFFRMPLSHFFSLHQ